MKAMDIYQLSELDTFTNVGQISISAIATYVVPRRHGNLPHEGINYASGRKSSLSFTPARANSTNAKSLPPLRPFLKLLRPQSIAGNVSYM